MVSVNIESWLTSVFSSIIFSLIITDNRRSVVAVRKQCSDLPRLTEKVVDECKVTEIWVEDYIQIAEAMEENKRFDNVYMLAVSSHLAKPYLVTRKVFGYKQAIVFDEYISHYTAMSMELTAGAVLLAVKDYCDKHLYLGNRIEFL